MKAPVTPPMTRQDAVVLTWLPPTAGNPPLCQPRYRVKGATTWIPFGAPVAGSRVAITGLSALTSYDFDVIAISHYTSYRYRIMSLTPAPTVTSQPELPRLPICEFFIALTAPKGRIDEMMGDHSKELRDLVRDLGPVRGVWTCRLRLAGTTLRMLPTIIMRLAVLWRIISG